MSKYLKVVLTAALIVSPAVATAGKLGVGRVATPAEITAWDTDVRPDATGLPPGKGTVSRGETVFTDRCAICHGDFGEGVGRWPVLAGGQDTLTSGRPVKTIGSYWPYLSTVWDYIHRAMPFGDAGSLSNDDVYAITAYLLYMNDVVTDDTFELNQSNFTSIHLPNENGFIADDRSTSPIALKRDVCMSNCKDSVKITGFAAVVDVTPEETKAAAAAAAAKSKAAEATSQSTPTTSEAATQDATPATATPAAVPDPALIAKGKKIFRKCKACHKIGKGAKNGIGPELNALFGRTAGTAKGYKYSKNMKAAGAAGLVWDEGKLSEFLTKPKSMIAKTRMSFAGLKKETDRAAIIAYLKSAGMD